MKTVTLILDKAPDGSGIDVTVHAAAESVKLELRGLIVTRFVEKILQLLETGKP